MLMISSVHRDPTQAPVAVEPATSGDIADETPRATKADPPPPIYRQATTHCAHCRKYHDGNPYKEPNPPKRSEQWKHFKPGVKAPGTLTLQQVKADRLCNAFGTIFAAMIVISLSTVGAVRKDLEDIGFVWPFVGVSAWFFLINGVNWLCSPNEKMREQINLERIEIMDGLVCRCGSCDSTDEFWCVATQRAEWPYLPKKKKNSSSSSGISGGPAG